MAFLTDSLASSASFMALTSISCGSAAALGVSRCRRSSGAVAASGFFITLSVFISSVAMGHLLYIKLSLFNLRFYILIAGGCLRDQTGGVDGVVTGGGGKAQKT